MIKSVTELEADMLLHSMLRLELAMTLGMEFLPSRDRSGNTVFLDRIVALREALNEIAGMNPNDGHTLRDAVLAAVRGLKGGDS